MENKPQDAQSISTKEFREFVEEFKKSTKLEFATSVLRTSYTKEIARDDDDKRTKQVDLTNERLEKLQKAFDNLAKTLKNSNDKIANKLDNLGNKQSPEFKPLDKIKDNRPTTLKEELKSGVAGVKRFGSSIVSGVKGFGERLREQRTPSSDLKAAGGFIEKLGSEAKDILGTSKDYTVEGGRFAEAYSRTAKGTQYQEGGKGSEAVGLENYNELKKKEGEIAKLEEKMKKQSDYGFEPNKGDKEQLDRLKKQHAKMDLRNQSAPIVPKKEEPKQETAPIERKQVDSPIVDQYGKSFQRSQTDEEMAAEKSTKSSLILDDSVKPKESQEQTSKSSLIVDDSIRSKKQQVQESQSANVEADNVESPAEIMAEVSKDNLDITKQLLDTTKESLTQLRAIREAVTATPSGSGTGVGGGPSGSSAAAPAAAPAEESSSSSILDQFGNPFEKGKPSTPTGTGSAAKKGLGGKIMGGAKSIGGKILSGAKGLASKIPGGALAGAGVGIAGMAGEYIGGKLEEAGHEKTGAAVSTLGTAAKYGGMGMAIGSVVPGIGTAIGGAIGGAVGLGMGLYDNAGKMFGGSKDEKPAEAPSGKEDKRLEEVKRARSDALQEAVKAVEAAIDGGKDTRLTGELQAIAQQVTEKYSTLQGGTLSVQSAENLAQKAVAIAIQNKSKKQEKPADVAADPTGMGSDSDFKPVDTGSLRQGDKGLKAQQEEFAAQSKPVEEKKSLGERIKNFFGFGNDEVQEREAGGPVTGGKPYLVGEEGPEIIVPKNDSKVKTNEEYERVAAEAKEINQKYGKKEDGDLGDGISKVTAKDGTYKITGSFGMYEYSSGGSLISYSSPSLKGFQFKIHSKETGGMEAGGGSIEARYNVGPLSTRTTKSLSGEQISAEASYNMGMHTVSAKQSGSGPVAASLSENNAAIKDEMQYTSKSSMQPIVSNNVQSSNTTSYVPIKSDPRPSSRGSALDRYSDRVAAY